jgi:hypothetical protein
VRCRRSELQVLDSVGQPAANDTCGAVYGVRAPLLVACNEQLVARPVGFEPTTLGFEVRCSIQLS